MYKIKEVAPGSHGLWFLYIQAWPKVLAYTNILGFCYFSGIVVMKLVHIKLHAICYNI